MREKNKYQDRFFTHIRSPYERVFSKPTHRVRYKGVVKNQFALFMGSMAFNLKRTVALELEYGN